MKCKKCGSYDVKDWPFNLYGRRGYMIHCVHCGQEYFRSNDEYAKDLKEEKMMTAKDCLVEFKKNYCTKGPDDSKDPDFRCNGCLFSTDTRCLVNTFISRQDQEEYFGSKKNNKEDK